MDKVGLHSAEVLLSKQVSGTRYFFLNLAPTATGTKGLAVTLGGRERCNPDYEIRRSAYSYHGLEYVAEGAGEVELDGVKQPLRPGSVFAYAPSTACEMRTDPERPMVKYFVCFTGASAARRLRRAGVGPGTVGTLATHAEIRDVMDNLVREGQRPGPLARTICAQLFELLLLKIEDAAATGVVQGDPAQENFQRCKALIDAEAERLHTLREIAAAAGLEESSVCRLFRRYQDTSPYQYLLRRKMNLAAAFLVEGRGRVKEAAQCVGFADPYHFSRCFKAVHGVAPSELLKHRSQP
jgi:AraC family transcriptional regulator